MDSFKFPAGPVRKGAESIKTAAIISLSDNWPPVDEVAVAVTAAVRQRLQLDL